MKSNKENEALVYTFRGLHGVILEVDDANGYDLTPIETDAYGLGFYTLDDIREAFQDGLPDELRCRPTYDDSYAGYCAGELITCDRITNNENEQELLQEVFVTLEYYEYDTAKRMLITDTNLYHDWTSARTDMRDYILQEIDIETIMYDDDGNKLSLYEIIDLVAEKVKREWGEKWRAYNGEVLDEDENEELIKIIEHALMY